jgi:uncharacterized protein (TIGR02266 family)
MTDREEQSQRPDTASTNSAGGVKILLVDDVELFLELEKTFFSRMNTVETLLARSGKQALEAIRRDRPQLVYMDLYMPDMDGDQCCRMVKSDPELAKTPIVMVTGGGKEEDFERCWQAGCDDIIVKPINPNQFMAMAKKYLNVALRAAPRYADRLTVSYSTSDNSEQSLTNYTVNISTGGVFLETASPLPVDTKLRLEIQLPGQASPLRTTARVAWVNDAQLDMRPNLPKAMGLQFLEITLKDLHLLREHLQKNSEASGE